MLMYGHDMSMSIYASETPTFLLQTEMFCFPYQSPVLWIILCIYDLF